MSTVYDYIGPVDLDAILPKLKSQFEIEIGTNSEGSDYLTDGTNYLHINPFEWKNKKHLSTERWGGNDVHYMISAISELTDVDFVDEHDDDYFELPWNIDQFTVKVVKQKRDHMDVVPCDEEEADYIFERFIDVDELIEMSKDKDTWWVFHPKEKPVVVIRVDEQPKDDNLLNDQFTMPHTGITFWQDEAAYENSEA